MSASIGIWYHRLRQCMSDVAELPFILRTYYGLVLSYQNTNFISLTASKEKLLLQILSHNTACCVFNREQIALSPLYNIKQRLSSYYMGDI